MIRAAGLGLALLAGCGETHDVDYYRTHDAARVAQLAECDRHAGQDRLAADCLNARRAADPLGLHQKAMPSIGMPAETPP